MLRSNLKVLLAERNLKITRVAADTGISRTTLTALNSNTSKMVQFDTINKLCSRLRINPGQLFVYSPIDFTFQFAADDDGLTSRSTGDPYENTRDFAVGSLTGDAFVTITRGFSEPSDTIELRFSTSPFSFLDQVYQNPPIDLAINDENKEFETFWSENNLFDFNELVSAQVSSEFSRQCGEQFTSKLDEFASALDYPNDIPTPIFEAQLPVLPF